MAVRVLSEDDRCGAVVDIRSDGVRIAAVLSDLNSREPEILWSHFEPVSPTARSSEEGIIRSLRHAFDKLETAGQKVLNKVYPGLSPEKISVSVAAPLSETVARGFQFPAGKSIDINTKPDKLKKLGSQHGIPSTWFNKLDLDVSPGSVVKVNGNPYQFITLSRGHLKRELEALRNRFYPGAELELQSFVAGCFSVLNDLPHQTGDVCIIDLSPRATELHVVSNGRPLRSRYIDFGLSDLASNASKDLGLSPDQVKHLFSDNDVDIVGNLSEKQRGHWDSAVNDFENRIRKLLTKADAEKLPETAFLSVDPNYWGFAKNRVRKAAEPLVKDTTILPLSAEIFGLKGEEDPIILLNTYIFHTKYR